MRKRLLVQLQVQLEWVEAVAGIAGGVGQMKEQCRLEM